MGKITNNGRFNLIDPNHSGDDNNFENNIFVPLEDLNISVELTTSTKFRSILIKSTEGGSTNTTQDADARISFIEGTEINGIKHLTTKYTDLQEVNTSNNETLGITNIEIAFNSSYAPMITINFVDVRGAAIFQNEANSKFGVLFKLPYPIFKLEIKGYFGKPVSYCLHLTKVSSKFNSQTGNFEITANFVGYTYAMFTDILLGYLKAIGYIDDGLAKLTARQVPTINNLSKSIAGIKGVVSAIQANDVNVNDLGIIKLLTDNLTLIENNINELQIRLGKTNNLLPKDNFLLIKASAATETTSFTNNTINFNAPWQKEPVVVKGDDLKSIDSYVSSIKKNIDDFNKLSGDNQDIKLNLNTFINIIKYLSINKKMLDENGSDIRLLIANANGLVVGGGDELITSIIDKLIIKLGDNSNLSETGVDIYDFTNPLKGIEEIKEKMNNDEISLKKKTVEVLRGNIETKLHFDPTIRSFINIITTHIEVFLEMLFDVSAKYKDPLRLAELNNFKTTKNLDVKEGHDIYPWPEYNEEKEEKYLGKKGVLTNPLNVPEIKFVEQIYQGILKSNADSKKVDEILNASLSLVGWYCVNPLDGYLSKDNIVSPYKRFTGTYNEKNIANAVLIRAVTFLGYSNKFLTTEEITSMAIAEAQLLISDIGVVDGAVQNPLGAFKMMLKNNITNVIDSSVTYGGITHPILKSTDDGYYEYIYARNNDLVGKDEIRKYIPIETGYNESFSVGETTVPQNILSNYNGNPSNKDVNGNGKLLDGATYVRILSDKDYDKSKSTMPSSVKQPTTKLVIENLNKIFFIPSDDEIKKIGFNPFGVTHGIQEFKEFEWDKTDFSGLEGKFNFYGDNSNINGFSKPRATNYTNENDLDEAGSHRISLLNITTNNIRNGFKSIGENKLLIASAIKKEKIAYPINNIYILTEYLDFNITISLFGSRFYYEQTKEVKALLFLHTLPWNGLTETEKDEKTAKIGNTVSRDANFAYGLLSSPKISNLFQLRAGAVQVPKLWPVFVGGLLWRYKFKGDDPIKFFDGDTHFLPGSNDTVVYPKKDEYLTLKQRKSLLDTAIEIYGHDTIGSLSLNFRGYEDGQYMSLDTLLNLPEQVQIAFISEFTDFVNKTSGVKSDWDTISELLEIMPADKTGTDFVNLYENSLSLISTNSFSSIAESKIPIAVLKNNYKNVDQYVIFSLAIDVYKNNISLVLKDGSAAMGTLINYLIEGTSWIINTSPKIWNKSLITNDADKRFDKILVAESVLINYLTTFQTELDKGLDIKNKEVIDKQIFGSTDNDAIKLNIYRTLKAIYDKWIGGCNSHGEILFQCGGRLVGDTKRAKANGTEVSLIDSFRFVSRSFEDIGKKFFVNPTLINDIIRGDNNQSSYNIMTNILSKNNFDFIALPAYVDYNDKEEVEAIFKPYPYGTKPAKAGPSFVCVYGGQASTKLDFSKKSDYEHLNDSFDFPDTPPDFTPDKNDDDENKPVEDLGVAFMVNFGHQNQSFFKDITLDQSEFTESSESLKIMDELGSGKSINDKTYVGQNLFNVWSVRSYTAKVEMMGNAMIQPMMYFQLNNMPMFHGAYLITNVKHSIKPNYMSTNFSGLRMRANKTPLIDSATMYNGLLSELKLGVGATGTLSSIIGDGKNGDGYVTEEIIQNAGLVFQTKDLKGAKYALREVKNFMELLAMKWHEYAINKPFTDILYVNNLSKFHGTGSREGDNSKHNRGLAVDFRPLAKTKQVGTVSINGTNYDRDANKEFINFALKLIKTDGNGLQFDNIILNDKVIIDSISDLNRNNGKIVISWPGHEDHIHMEFYVPKRIVDRITAGYLSEENIISNNSNATLKPLTNNATVNQPSSQDIAFYSAILKGLSAPVSDINLKTLYAWRQGEGAEALHNPFNTTLSYPNATVYNCKKVRNYASAEDGITATVNTLLHPVGRYQNILSGLRAEKDISGFLTELSLWGTGQNMRNALNGKTVSPPEITRVLVQIKKC